MPQENRIQRGDIGQRLTRSLEIKGQGSPALTLDNIVAPVVVVEDITRPRNWQDPTERVAASSGVATGANRAGACLSNPVGSNVVAVLRQLTFSDANSIVSEFNIGFWDPANLPVGVNTNRWLDSRNGPPGTAACVVRDGDDAAPRIATILMRLQGTLPNISPPGLGSWEPIILPGEAFGVQMVVAGGFISASFIWSEFSLA